jgi:NADH dehydrogenase [ubiquinone] 1 alpha subcomplex assembly factor 3
MKKNNSPIVIDSYNNDKIILSNKEIITGSFIIDDEGNFSAYNKNNITTEDLAFLHAFINKKEIFLVGCGDKFIIPPPEIKTFVSSLGLKLEWMITKSALHTYNLMIDDYRQFIALIINTK